MPMTSPDGTDGEPDTASPATVPTMGAHGFLGAVRRFIESAGGFTLHHRTGEHVSDGLSVCADPGATLRFPLDEWDDAQVEHWFETWAGHLPGSDLHLGGWLDPVTRWVSFDVVRVYPADRRREAVRLGHVHRQQAVFDLGTGRLLALAGPVAAHGPSGP